MEKGYSYLLKNLCDSVFEMMCKLNEMHNRSMCIYYTEDLAAFLLGTENVNDMIYGFSKYARPYIGQVDVERASDGRYGLRVYSKGIDSIMQSNPRGNFLKELISRIRSRDCSVEEIKSIFAAESPDYICEEINNSEFQYVIYFKDENIDEYKYCFTFDAMGSYYHRLIEYDFEKLIHADCELKR